jgi:hypothetical protein
MLSRKVKYLVPSGKASRPQHRYCSRHSWREAAPCFGRRQMWDRIGSSSAMATLDFDSVDRCFAKMAAAGFVWLIAVVMWAWLS